MNPEDKREVRADARDVRADARDVRSDALDVDLADRGVRADVREDVVTEREGTVSGGIRVLKWLVSVLIVISMGNFMRTFVVQDATDRATEAAREATEAANSVKGTSAEGRDASLETLAELRAILQQIEERNQNDPGPGNQAIIEALQAIARIEGFICGGPCPEPE